MKVYRYLVPLMLGLSLLLGSCLKSDVDDLKSDLKKLEERLKALEDWKETVNTNITSLQALINAMENQVLITDVQKLTENGVEIGYVISFSNNTSVEILHGNPGADGSDGADGSTPVIGVKQHTDGKYYWTVSNDGGEPQWLLDGQGNKIRADAVAPQVRINSETEEWEISTDGGTTWVSTGVKATGTGGGGGTPIFAPDGVDDSNDDYVLFTLADGTSFRVPKYKPFGIEFEQPEPFEAGETKQVVYTVTGEEPDAILAVTIPLDWSFSVDMESRKFTVTAPGSFTAGVNDQSQIVLLVTDGAEKTVVRIIEVEEKEAPIPDDAVGDIYYENEVAVGVIMRLPDESRPVGQQHGLILHKEQASGMRWVASLNDLGVADENDGMVNQNATVEFDASFPIFEWAASLGEGWYIPAINELNHIYCSYTDIPYEVWGYGERASEEGDPDRILWINGKLEEMGGTALFSEGNYFYFSSTEANRSNALGVRFSDSYCSNANKTVVTVNYARAVKAYR